MSEEKKAIGMALCTPAEAKRIGFIILGVVAILGTFIALLLQSRH